MEKLKYKSRESNNVKKKWGVKVEGEVEKESRFASRESGGTIQKGKLCEK